MGRMQPVDSMFDTPGLKRKADYLLLGVSVLSMACCILHGGVVIVGTRGIRFSRCLHAEWQCESIG